MRPTNATQLTALAALDRHTHLRVWLEDSEGVLQNMTTLEGFDWLDEVIIEASEDEPIAGGVVTFWREAGAVSLAPLVEASPVNRDSGNNYGPLVVPGRRVEVEVATMLAGQTPAGGDWVLLLEGETDVPAWGGPRSKISATLRDPLAELHKTMIETQRFYGDDASPVPIQTVMQSILDDNMGVGAWPLRVIGDPDFGITSTGADGEPYGPVNVTVLEALRALADLQGWNLRYLWSEAHGEFRLTYYEPARTAVTPLYTFGPDDYYHVHDIRLDPTGIRNAGELWYVKADGADDFVSGIRQPSIDSYDRQFIRLDERNGIIRDATQAQTMLDAILDDLDDPPVAQHIEAAFFWPIECGDLYRWTANGDHYDTDQDWAVFGYRHVLTASKRRTDIFVRGAASGGFARWHTHRPPTQYRPSLKIISEERDAFGVTYRFERRCSSIWVYSQLVAQGAVRPLFTVADLVDVLTTQTEYEVAYPPVGYQRFIQFEPRGLDPSLIGESRLIVISALPVRPTFLNITHTEVGATATYGITLNDPSGLGRALYQHTKAGPEGFTEWSLVTLTPTHGTTYSQDVALVEGHPSVVEFRLDIEWGGETVPVYSTSAPFDFGALANVSELTYEFRNDRLWVFAAGDSDTRTEGIILIGNRTVSPTVDPTLAAHDFKLENPFGATSRGGAINTGINIANPGLGLTVTGYIGVRAIDIFGVPGPTHWITYQRVGTTPTSASIDTLVVTTNQVGTSCASPARQSVEYAVTAGGTDTVTLERYVDGVLDGTPIVATAVHSQTYVDDLPFHSNTSEVIESHWVHYRLIVKTSGGTPIISEITEDVLWASVEPCP